MTKLFFTKSESPVSLVGLEMSTDISGSLRATSFRHTHDPISAETTIRHIGRVMSPDEEIRWNNGTH
jgi:hypothetical protein